MDVRYEALRALQIIREEPDQEGSVIASASGCALYELDEMADNGLIDMGVNRIEKNRLHPFITKAGKAVLSAAEARGIIKPNLNSKQKKQTTTDQGLYPEIDNDGYPTEETLNIIRHWDASRPKELFGFIAPIFEQYGRCICKDGNIYEIATGGWSGCEDAIYAMQQNHFFWMMHWYLSKRGGYYEFKLRI